MMVEEPGSLSSRVQINPVTGQRWNFKYQDSQGYKGSLSLYSQVRKGVG
jgi:hypothetical protein